MGIMVRSLSWVMQDLDHQPQYVLWPESPPEARCRNLIGVADSAENGVRWSFRYTLQQQEGKIRTFSMKSYFSGVLEPYCLSPNLVPHKRFSGPSKHLFLKTL